MAGFLYFVPNTRFPESGQLDKLPDACLGLAPILEEGSWSVGTVANNGPRGLAGSLIAVEPTYGSGGSVARIGYYPDEQCWIGVRAPQGTPPYPPLVKGGNELPLYWVGYEKANPPRPQDLIRPRTVGGMPAVLRDRNAYTIPILHAMLDGEIFTTVPRTFSMTEGGPQLSIDDRYAALCARGKQLFETVMTPGAKWPFDALGTAQFACELLGCNYRLGPWEISALELLDTQNSFVPCRIAVGFAAADEDAAAQKKTADEAEGTTPA